MDAVPNFSQRVAAVPDTLRVWVAVAWTPWRLVDERTRMVMNAKACGIWSKTAGEDQLWTDP